MRKITKDEMNKIWKDCLVLWEAISIIPDTMFDEFQLHAFKKEMQRKLGQNVSIFGCPMCKAFIGDNCKNCPIGEHELEVEYTYEDCYRLCEINEASPYALWKDEYPNHNQERAEAFYKYLIMLAKKDEYKPDCSFKFW